MNIAIIGMGAISAYVSQQLAKHGVSVTAFLVRPGNLGRPGWINKNNLSQVSSVEELLGGESKPQTVDLLVDCAGHEGLNAHGVAALERGLDVVTISIGALADKELEKRLTNAALKGNSKLHLASGAIGALDTLRAARTGSIEFVKYTGRKPPAGWVGSAAESKLDLANIDRATVHFQGSAREAAIKYPQNANVAAAVALSSLGFDKTSVELIADPTIESNIHEVEARGEFGELHFMVKGRSLSDNPKSSALAAMSLVDFILSRQKTIVF